MTNEHEIKEREQITVLEMLQIAMKLNDAHSKLLMRRYSETMELLVDIKRRINSVIILIPLEDDE